MLISMTSTQSKPKTVAEVVKAIADLETYFGPVEVHHPPRYPNGDIPENEKVLAQIEEWRNS